MSRTFARQRVWRLDEARVLAGSALLADAATEFFGRFTAVLGIGRGGWCPAEVIGDALHTQLVHVRAKHNDDDDLYNPGGGAVQVETSGGAGLKVGSGILIVDDICGTGATLAAVHEAISARLHPARLHTITLCRNVGSSRLPGMWVWNVDDWVVFPWEQAPTTTSDWLPRPSTVNLPEYADRQLVVGDRPSQHVPYPA